MEPQGMDRRSRRNLQSHQLERPTMTPTPEQVAAAERYRELREAFRSRDMKPCEIAEIVTLRMILADAYLAHLDTREREDGRAVDEAWLLSIGFEKWGDGAYRGYYLRTHLRSYMLHSTADGWKFSIGSTTLLVNPTRGQLRRLLESLNINISSGA